MRISPVTRPTAAPMTPLPPRASQATVWATLILLVAAASQVAFWSHAGPIASGDAADTYHPESQNPYRLVSWIPRSAYIDGSLPLERLAQLLTTPMAVGQFLERHAHYRLAAGICQFTVEYRLSLTELQARNWEGDCNDLANAVCELVSRQGHPIYVLTVWPRNWQDRLSREWHQMAVLCVQEERCYVIYDNGRPYVWHGPLSGFIAQIDMEVLPVGGLIPWRPVKANPVARFCDHLRWNERPRATQQAVDLTHRRNPVT